MGVGESGLHAKCPSLILHCLHSITCICTILTTLFGPLFAWSDPGFVLATPHQPKSGTSTADVVVSPSSFSSGSPLISAHYSPGTPPHYTPPGTQLSPSSATPSPHQCRTPSPVHYGGSSPGMYGRHNLLNVSGLGSSGYVAGGAHSYSGSPNALSLSFNRVSWTARRTNAFSSVCTYLTTERGILFIHCSVHCSRVQQALPWYHHYSMNPLTQQAWDPGSKTYRKRHQVSALAEGLASAFQIRLVFIWQLFLEGVST